MRYRWRTPVLARRMWRWVGFRGYFLLTLALVDVYMGLSFVRAGTSGQRAINAYLADAIPFSDPHVSDWVWALAWWATAAFCVVNAFRRRDHWGFGMAIAIKVAYVVTIVYASRIGLPDAGRRVVIWSWITSTVWVTSRWREPGRSMGSLTRELDETGKVMPARPGGDDAA